MTRSININSIAILAIIIAWSVPSALAMNNYDDPRIEKGFVNRDIAGDMDIIKLTFEARDQSLIAKLYLRSEPDLSAPDSSCGLWRIAVRAGR